MLFAMGIGVGMKLSFHTLNPYWEVHHVPIVWFGYALAGYNLLAALSSLLSPWLMRLLGEKRVPWGIVAIVCGGFFLMALLEVTPLWAVLLPAIFQIPRELFPLWTNRVIHEHTRSQERATTLSMKSLMGQLSQMLYLPLFGLMTDTWSLQTAYFLTALLMLVLSAIAIKQMWKTPHNGGQGGSVSFAAHQTNTPARSQ